MTCKDLLSLLVGFVVLFITAQLIVLGVGMVVGVGVDIFLVGYECGRSLIR